MGKLLIPGALLGIGLGLVIVSVIFGFVVVPNIIESKIKEQVQLDNGTDTWDKWQESPVPIYLKFYIFNVTNPKAIEENGKPKLEEVGPYVFSETRVKTISNIDDEKDEITYRQTIKYFFEEEMSITKDGVQLSLDDVVNIANLPFISVATTLASMDVGVIAGPIMNILISKGESFVKEGVVVGDTLFNGWEYPTEIALLLQLTGSIPPEFEGGRFGYYRGQNGSNDGEYVISAGKKVTADFGLIQTWEQGQFLDFWANPSSKPNATDAQTCNGINGTDGGIFAPFIKKDTIIPVFVTDICRSVVFVYEKDEKFKGVPGYKFVFPDSFYEHPETNSNNYCFCPSPGHPNLNSDCYKGAIRLFPCKNGAPLVTTSPHFYNSDDYFKGNVDGMNPSKEEHETFAVIEPNSGLLLKIRKTLQMSLEVQDFGQNFHPYFNNVTHLLLPALWANEYVELDDENIDEIKGMLIKPLQIVDITKWVIIGVGGVIFLTGIALFIKNRR